MIDHVKHDGLAVLPGGHDRRLTGRGVRDRVGEEVCEHPFQQARVGSHEREIVGDDQPDGHRRVGIWMGQRGHLVTEGRPQERLERACAQPAHVEQVADQAVQPVGRLLDGREQRRLVLVSQLDLGLAQRADARLDRRQRRPQVVTDRREQRGSHPVPLGQRLSLSRLSPQPVAIQGRRRLRREAVEQPRRDLLVLPGHSQREIVAGPDPDRLGRGGRQRRPAPTGTVPAAATLTH